MKGIDQFRDRSLNFARQLCEIRNSQELEKQRPKTAETVSLASRSRHK